MKRRDFLKATLVSTGGLWLAGCPDPTNLDTDGGADSSVDASTDVDSAFLPPETYFPSSVVSGDPKPESVIVWTRLWDASRPDSDLALTLEVALGADFANPVSLGGGPEMALTAKVQWDHCVKVKLTGLTPYTVYYYRFTYNGGDKPTRTRTGRTKTAPAANADTAVRMGVVTCQDRRYGTYYNTYKRLIEQHPDELDFIVHLGDYIYEKSTTVAGMADTPRPISFTDTAGAILLFQGTEDERYAARTLGNYRELYQQYRADPWLQRVHEAYAFINLWDDHEFANDCWGINGTDLSGRQSEADEERRKNANQAWFEYQPIDFTTPDFEYDPSVSHPNDITIYRDFIFGQHVHLVVTDLRTYRVDHPVAEDALPGTVAVDEGQLLTLLGEVPADARPYVDIDTYDGGSLVAPLQDHGADADYDPARITGLLSIAWINDQISEINAAGGTLTVVDDTDPNLEFGYSFIALNKTSNYSGIGSRNLVVRGPYDAYCAVKFAASGGASELVMGETQRQWFYDTLQNSAQTFKLWANEFCLNHMGIDLGTFANLPESFQKKFYVICDDWTCFPSRKAEVLDTLSAIGNVVSIAGDVHAFFAATPFVAGDPNKRIVELVTSSISSATIRSELVETANSDPGLAAAGAAALAFGIGELMQDPVTKPSPQLGYQAVASQGFITMVVNGTEIRCTMNLIEEAHSSVDLSDDADFDAKWTQAEFRVDNGSADLYHQMDDGTWRQWDIAQAAWV